MRGYSECVGPCGLMDKASDFESEDCGFESRHGRYFFFFSYVGIVWYSGACVFWTR